MYQCDAVGITAGTALDNTWAFTISMHLNRVLRPSSLLLLQVFV